MFKLFVFNSPERVGMFSVWLGDERADKLKGSYVHITLDIEESETDSEDIVGRAY
jgi:hypothetical protein